MAAARRMLVLQGDIHRSLLRLETITLRERLGSLTTVPGKLAVGRPLLYSSTVVAAVLAARRWRRLARWGPVAVAAYRWVRRLSRK